MTKTYVIFPNIEKPEQETEKALKLFGQWMPKSQVQFSEKYVAIPLWLFIQKSLSYWDIDGHRVAQKITENDLPKWLGA